MLRQGADRLYAQAHASKGKANDSAAAFDKPNTTPLVTNACTMINHANGAMRWSEVVAALLSAEASTLLCHGIATTHTERLPGDVAGAVRG